MSPAKAATNASYSDDRIPLTPGCGPGGITAGPDGALWFTNTGNGGSIGRITTAGAVTNYTGTGISDPVDMIAAGTDGALWFVNQRPS